MKNMICCIAVLLSLSSFQVLADAGVADPTPVVVMAPVAVEGTLVVDAGVIEVPATTAVDPSLDVGFVVDTAKSISNAVKNKEWGKLIFLIITALIIVIRKVLVPRVKFFQNQLAAPIMAFLLAAAGALAVAWPAGTKLSALDAFLALQAGLMSIGGWSLLKNVLEHFSPKEAGQANWATVLLGWLKPSTPAPAPAEPTAPVA